MTALSPASLRRWILLFAITLGFMARMATFQVPLFDHHSWRQADGATIARNFYREGLTPLRPTIDARGDSAEGTVATGLELHSLMFAAVSRVTGFSDMVGRVVSALCFPASVLLLWSFCRSRYGEDHALIAAFVYSLGLPLVVYAERSIWNEPVLLLLSMAALASAQAYSVDARPLQPAGAGRQPVAARCREAAMAHHAGAGLGALVRTRWLAVSRPLGDVAGRHRAVRDGRGVSVAHARGRGADAADLRRRRQAVPARRHDRPLRLRDHEADGEGHLRPGRRRGTDRRAGRAGEARQARRDRRSVRDVSFISSSCHTATGATTTTSWRWCPRA